MIVHKVGGGQRPLVPDHPTPPGVGGGVKSPPPPLKKNPATLLQPGRFPFLRIYFNWKRRKLADTLTQRLTKIDFQRSAYVKTFSRKSTSDLVPSTVWEER